MPTTTRYNDNNNNNNRRKKTPVVLVFISFLSMSIVQRSRRAGISFSTVAEAFAFHRNPPSSSFRFRGRPIRSAQTSSFWSSGSSSPNLTSDAPSLLAPGTLWKAAKQLIDGDDGDVPARNEELCNSWTQHPELNLTITFPSWKVPLSAKSIQSIIESPVLHKYLALRLELLKHINFSMKMVRDYDIPSRQENRTGNDSSSERYKLILLHPDTPPVDQLPVEIQKVLAAHQVTSNGPTLSIPFSYKQFTANYVLSKLLPPECHPPPSSFETIGHVAHLNLREIHLPYRYLIGQVLLEALPPIQTVIRKVGDVSGPYRTYPFEVLAGRNDTQVELTEHGLTLQFDVANVYWCSRLLWERKRLLKSEIRKNDIIADPFAGVGAFVLQAAKYKNCIIWANDWNPHAIAALRRNFLKNDISPNKLQRVQCGDAYEFLMDIGLQCSHQHGRLPDHVVMNYPLEAPTFLGALRWWPAQAPTPATRRRASSLPARKGKGKNAPRGRSNRDAVVPRVHVYTFARADPGTNRSAEQVAMDVIASNLLPLGEDVHRGELLNAEYDCRLKAHEVRDVAPGKVVFCVSFSATPRLLRHMQGDFD